METPPMKFTDAERCLRLTITVLGLDQNDAAFLGEAMRTYAAAKIGEYLAEQSREARSVAINAATRGTGVDVAA